jgi:rubredoxin
VPTTVEVTDFNYTYKCKHCGHMWTELHQDEEKDESKDKPE